MVKHRYLSDGDFNCNLTFDRELTHWISDSMSQNDQAVLQGKQHGLFGAKELAGLLNVSLRHVQSLKAAGRLPRPIRLGRSVRWRASEIHLWIDEGCPSQHKWEEILKLR